MHLNTTARDYILTCIIIILEIGDPEEEEFIPSLGSMLNVIVRKCYFQFTNLRIARRLLIV